MLAVFDNSTQLSKEDVELLEKCSGKLCIAVINKCDLENNDVRKTIEKYIKHIVEISAKTGEGKNKLENCVTEILGTDKIDTSCALLTDERQYYCSSEALKCVNEAIDALNSGVTLDAVNVMIDSAVDFLQTLTGEKASESVVNEIFSKFCVGK